MWSFCFIWTLAPAACGHYVPSQHCLLCSLSCPSPPPNSGRLAPGSSGGEEGENFLSSPLFLFQHTKKGQRDTIPPAPHSLLCQVSSPEAAPHSVNRSSLKAQEQLGSPPPV